MNACTRSGLSVGQSWMRTIAIHGTTSDDVAAALLDDALPSHPHYTVPAVALNEILVEQGAASRLPTPTSDLAVRLFNP
jgi:hypothetical protein